MVTTVRTYLPRGNNLDDETFQRRHLFLTWVLALHVPALFAFGLWRGFDALHVALELTVPLACVAFGRLAINRRLAAFFVTAGLVYCSVVLVHLSGGAIEAHFHFFILIGLIALYQDWVPFLWNVVFTVLSHGVGSVIGSNLMFSHNAGQSRPWTWAAIHGAAVLAACVGEIIFWKSTEQEQQRNVELVASLATADAERRQAMSELLVNLARRNQSLLNRQLEVITDLELRERQPDVLEDLFSLDHLATRIRRNAESLLVLSGDDPARKWGNPVPLGDVVRAAAAEVEDYRRVEVLVNDHIEVAGRAVADLAHLLAELIENATTFSPPSTEVRVRSQLASDRPSTTVISIEDQGLGMPEDDLRTINALLAEAPEVDLGRSTMLGFHVVARLTQRYGLTVRLAPTPGGGVTAMVTLPDDLVSERRGPVGVGAGSGLDRYAQAAAAWPGSEGRLSRLNGVNALNGAATVGLRAEPAALTQGPSAWDGGPLGDAAAPSAGVPAWDGGPRADASAVPSAPPDGATHTGAADVPEAGPAGTGDPGAQGEAAALAQTVPASTEVDLSRPEPFFPAGPPPAFALGPAPPPVPPVAPAAWWWESESLVRRPEADAHRDAPPPATPLPEGWGASLAGQPARVRASVWPARQPMVAPPNGPEPADAVVPALADGLVRRVPGAHLAPSLRRDAASAPAPSAPPPAAAERDPGQVRSMLSKFQAGQRAGRAAVDPPPADLPQEHR